MRGLSYKGMLPRFISLLLILPLLLAIWIGSFSAQAAGNASLSISPGAGSFPGNTNLTFSITENSGSQPVNAVQAILNYDSSKLEFVGVSTSGSPFTTCVQVGPSANKVVIACALMGGTVTGSQNVGAVTFRTLAGSGSTSINFASDSAVVKPLSEDNNQNIWNENTSGGKYNLTPATSPASPPPQPSTPSNPSGSNSSSGGNTSASSPASAQSSLRARTAVATLSSGYSSASLAAQQSDPTVPVPVGDDNPSLSPEQSGYVVAIRVVDNSDNPVEGAEVTLGDQAVKTDPTGIASFMGVAAGKYDIKVVSSKGDSLAILEVEDNGQYDEIQQLTVKLKEPKVAPYIVLILIGLTLLLAAAIANIGRFTTFIQGLKPGLPKSLS